MQKQFTRTLPVLIAAVATVASAHGAFPNYRVDPAVTLPLTSTDGVSSAMTTTYTTIASLTSLPRATRPNGAASSLIVGSISGTKPNPAGGTASVNTAFAYDPIVGFRLIGKYTLTSAGGHTNTNVRSVNEVGQVIGSTPLNSTQSTDSNGLLGTEAWLYSTTDNSNISLGLTGPNYSYQRSVPANGAVTPTAFVDTFRISTPGYINNLGAVVGTTNRFAGTGQFAPATSLGTSAWLYNPVGNTTTEIGLLDSNHSYNFSTGTAPNTTAGRFSSNGIVGFTDTGFTVGTANAYYNVGDGTGTGLGNDAWISNGVTTTAIGLYARGIAPNVSSGGAADTYQYYQLPTVGTTGPTPSTSQVRSTSLTALNDAGQAIGSSQYYSVGTNNFKGSDAFVYSAGTYRQLGFFSNEFTSATPAPGTASYTNTGATQSTTGRRFSEASYINGSGKIVGRSERYHAYNNPASVLTFATGFVAWIDSGAGPTRIGLYNQIGDPNPKHVNPQTGAASSSVSNLTESGYVAGSSQRFYLSAGGVGTQYGQDAWVYDSNTQTISLVGPAQTYNDVYVNTLISYLSEDGVAVGQYSVTANQSSSGSINKAFIWSLAGGFIDLNQYLPAALTVNDYRNLINSFFSDTGGSTLYATASKTVSATNNGIVMLTGIPEPTSLSAVAAGAIILRRRRH